MSAWLERVDVVSGTIFLLTLHGIGSFVAQLRPLSTSTKKWLRRLLRSREIPLPRLNPVDKELLSSRVLE
jgi:hypothetical protein